MRPTRGGIVLLTWLVAVGVLAGCSRAGGADAADEADDAVPVSEAATAVAGRLPSITLDALDPGGEPTDLADLRGPAVVNLWASWCGPCREEIPVLQEFHERHPGVAVIGIDYQDQQADAAAALVEQTGADYPMYADPTGELSGRTPFPSLRGLPYTALVDDRGRLVHGEFVQIEDVEQLERMVRRHLDGGGLR